MFPRPAVRQQDRSSVALTSYLEWHSVPTASCWPLRVETAPSPSGTLILPKIPCWTSSSASQCTPSHSVRIGERLLRRVPMEMRTFGTRHDFPTHKRRPSCLQRVAHSVRLHLVRIKR